MGILNLTPDSFFNQYIYPNNNKIKKIYKTLQKADIIDIGAESPSPGSNPISYKDEIKRLSIVEEITEADVCLSIDSYKPKVIKYCLDKGFSIINDISGGGKNFENIDLACEYNVPIIIMHMQGNPSNMQNDPKYDNIIDDLRSFFDIRINYALKIGLDIDKIILDPGIGFGKTIHDNDNIILNLDVFKKNGNLLMIGISRKSFLSFNNDLPTDRLSQSLGILALAVYKGADIVRVHDTCETLKMINILDRIIRK